ncbi:MAG: VTT domain-containing protein [Candidatus Paceibacterota bacterium]
MRLIKKHLPKLIAAVFWVTLIYQFQHYRLINHLSYTDVLLQLIDFFTTSMWGPFVYMLAYTIRPLILFPATLLTALSGVLFGFWWGIIYTLIGENLSANLAYWIGRFFGKDLRLEDSVLGNWIEWLRSRPFESVLFMRLFYVPFDLCNYGSGVLGVRWASYALATFIGILPGLTTFVALGAAINLEQLKMDGLTYSALDPKYLALSVGIFIFSIVLSRLLRRFKAE